MKYEFILTEQDVSFSIEKDYSTTISVTPQIFCKDVLSNDLKCTFIFTFDWVKGTEISFKSLTFHNFKFIDQNENYLWDQIVDYNPYDLFQNLTFNNVLVNHINELKAQITCNIYKLYDQIVFLY
jgi:hypothetical protein